MLSATWFPPGERTTATAILAASLNVGVAVAFALGPQLMPPHVNDDDVTSQQLDDVRAAILKYMWIYTGFSGAVFLSALVYFPNRPPHAPSRSADTSRMSFVDGLKALLRHRQFWLIATAYGVITGVYSSWSAYLEPNLQQFLDASEAQDESGWIGFYGTIAGCVSGVGVGLLSDRLGGKMKV